MKLNGTDIVVAEPPRLKFTEITKEVYNDIYYNAKVLCPCCQKEVPKGVWSRHQKTKIHIAKLETFKLLNNL